MSTKILKSSFSNHDWINRIKEIAKRKDGSVLSRLSSHKAPTKICCIRSPHRCAKVCCNLLSPPILSSVGTGPRSMTSILCLPFFMIVVSFFLLFLGLIFANIRQSRHHILAKIYLNKVFTVIRPSNFHLSMVVVPNHFAKLVLSRCSFGAYGKLPKIRCSCPDN